MRRVAVTAATIARKGLTPARGHPHQQFSRGARFFSAHANPVPVKSGSANGRAWGALGLVATGAAVLVGSYRAHAAPKFDPRSPAVAEPMLNAIREAAHHCIPLKLHEVDEEVIAATFEALRRTKGAKVGKDVMLTSDDVRLVMNIISAKSDGMATALFEALDTRGTGAVSLNMLRTAVAVLASQSQSQPPSKDVSSKFIFDFFDVGGQGKLTQANLEVAVKRLVNIALVQTDGQFLEYVHLHTPGQPDLTADDITSAVTSLAIRDIQGVSQKPISKDDFEMWLRNDSQSSRTVILLFQTMGAAISGAPGWDPTRYGGYTFLAARFIKLASMKVRYLAFSSDVGEAVRPVVPIWVVRATYGLAISYCVFDVCSVGHKESKKEHGNVTRAMIYQTLFQGLASIGIPYLIIHTAVHQSHKFCLKRAPKYAVLIPSLVGLAIIPLLPMFCDEPVEYLLEESFDYVWPHEKDPHHSG